MMYYATLDDVVAVYPPAADQFDLTGRYLERAQALLLERVPSIPRRIESGRLDPVLVTGVLVDMVVRVMSNASPGTESRQLTAGQFGISSRSAPGSNKIMVMESDLAGLLPRGSEFGTLRLRGPSVSRY